MNGGKRGTIVDSTISAELKTCLRHGRKHGTLVLLCLFMATACWPSLLAAEPSPAKQKATVKVDGLRGGEVSFHQGKQKGEQLECRILSPEGIGRVEFERVDRWPSPLVLRLNLKGLESLTLMAGKQRFNIFASSSPPHAVTVTKGEDEQPVAADAADRPAVRVLDGKFREVGKGKLPPEGGWFEITVPGNLLKDQERLQVHWIDFFRG